MGPSAEAPPAGELAFETMIRRYLRSSNPTEKREVRNTFVEASMMVIDARYQGFVSKFSAERKTGAVATDIASIALDGVATLINPASTKSIFAALSAGVTASGASVRENFFYEQTVPVLIKQMEARRLQVRAEIVQRMGLPIAGYPLAEAIGDLDQYYFAGSFDDALSAIQRDAAARALRAEIDADAFQIKFFGANREAGAAALLASIEAWVNAGGSEAANQDRFDQIAALVMRDLSVTDRTDVGPWLLSASEQQLEVIVRTLEIPVLATKDPREAPSE